MMSRTVCIFTGEHDACHEQCVALALQYAVYVHQRWSHFSTLSRLSCLTRNYMALNEARAVARQERPVVIAGIVGALFLSIPFHSVHKPHSQATLLVKRSSTCH